MIGRQFVKQLRWRGGRIEIITTRFELVADGQLIEHVTIGVQERPTFTAALQMPPVKSAGPAQRAAGRGAVI